jgi:hypothetical protein
MGACGCIWGAIGTARSVISSAAQTPFPSMLKSNTKAKDSLITLSIVSLRYQ